MKGMAPGLMVSISHESDDGDDEREPDDLEIEAGARLARAAQKKPIDGAEVYKALHLAVELCQSALSKGKDESESDEDDEDDEGADEFVTEEKGKGKY